LAYIVGSLNLAISGNTPCESSMDHEPLKSAVKSSLSELLGVPTSRVVITAVRCAARRLQGISESEDYTLAIEYALVVDSADGGAVAVENAIESLNVAQLDASLNDELAKANATQIEIKVESIVAPALVQYVTSTTVTTTTGSSAMRSSTRPGSVLRSMGPVMGHTSMAIAIVIAASFIAIIVSVCLLGRRRQQEQHAKPAFLDLEEQASMSTSFAV